MLHRYYLRSKPSLVPDGWRGGHVGARIPWRLPCDFSDGIGILDKGASFDPFKFKSIKNFRSFRLFFCRRICFSFWWGKTWKENKGTSCWVFQTTGQGPSTEVMRSIRWLSNSDFKCGNRIEQCQNDQNALQAVSVNITLENFCFSFMWVLFIWWS